MWLKKCTSALVVAAVIAGAGMGQISSTSAAQAAPSAEEYLMSGKLAEGDRALSLYLGRGVKNDEARFGLGMLQFLQAIERLSQDLYKYGLNDNTHMGFRPVRDLNIKLNPHPETVSYEKLRAVIQTFYDGLQKANETMAPITDPDVKLPIHFGLIKLDLDGDGKVSDGETLYKLYARLNRSAQVTDEQAKEFYIKFDRADVHWLRGYCNLLMGVSQLYLAHDTRETFDCTGHLFFAKTNSPYEFLTGEKHIGRLSRGETDFTDLISFIHLMRWEVAEPARMESALHHFEAMVAQNKDMWKYLMAETDDDHEWIPNPKQTGVIPNVQVSEEMATSWTTLMGKIDKILAGKLLLPFWRGNDNRGINLRKVFLEPRKMDIVLWIQGPAAAPYLEEGERVDGQIWRDLQRDFGSNFPGFAVWFN
ncbi:MAG: hypothetical protein KIT34_17830 [Cyanobacteria bacterium TGS_CYA1]|nr:hypothetical protein [Cyanobacteria bacterium TGS_CYA1]